MYASSLSTPSLYPRVMFDAIPQGNLPAECAATESAPMDADTLKRYEHRRARLAELVAALEAMGIKRAWFSTAIKKSDSYISRLLMDPDNRHRKNIGDELTSSICGTLGLAPGWFDQPIGNNLPANIRIDRTGEVRRPDKTIPPPRHQKLPFQPQIIDELIDLPERWQGRAEQAVLEVLKEFRKQSGDHQDEQQPEQAKH